MEIIRNLMSQFRKLGTWKLVYTGGDSKVVGLPLGAKDAPLLSGGEGAAPTFGGLLIGPTLITCEGTTPVLADFSSWANSTIGICTGTEGRYFTVIKHNNNIYPIEGISLSIWDALNGEGLPSGENKFITRSYLETYVATIVLGLAWQEMVLGNIHYKKAGTPTGVAAEENEKCLDTVQFLLHTFTGGSWSEGVALEVGDRYIFKVNGTDVSGDSGLHLADMTIMEMVNEDTIQSYVPPEGTVVPCLEDTSIYRFNGSIYTYFIAIFKHSYLAEIKGSGEHHLSQAEQEGISNSLSPISSFNPVASSDELKRLFMYGG